jgi:xanthine dehydrogenase small subunit
MATIAGNFVNASPIGDMTVFFLALNATIVLNNNREKRTILLKDFYKGYKQLDKQKDEFIESIHFQLPARSVFNFEKVCKRTYLDIASVNAACQLHLTDDGTIEDIHLAAGGVAPFPKFLTNTVSFLKGKQPVAKVLAEAIKIMNEEITPISDARGTAAYKRLLLRQLFLAHFASIQPNILKEVLQPAAY